ncbi:hypothetical protein HK405_010782, partial [Cladochytrium tenue]
LPNSVCSHEIYEPLKILYLSKSEEFAAMRTSSIKSLLATLSPPHYRCLMLLAYYWHGLTAGLDKEDPKLAELAQALGHLILRPRVETQLTAHDKHPARFLRDLLCSPLDVFASTAADGWVPPDFADDDDDGDGDAEDVADGGGGSGSGGEDVVRGSEDVGGGSQLGGAV